jgi:hypothetical protein
MVVIAVQDYFLAIVDEQYMDTGKELKYPTGRRFSGKGSELIGECYAVLVE